MKPHNSSLIHLTKLGSGASINPEKAAKFYSGTKLGSFPGCVEQRPQSSVKQPFFRVCFSDLNRLPDDDVEFLKHRIQVLEERLEKFEKTTKDLLEFMDKTQNNFKRQHVWNTKVSTHINVEEGDVEEGSRKRRK